MATSKRKLTSSGEVIAFLSDLFGYDKLQPDSDIAIDAGIDGDDFHEMVEKFGKKFNVDVSSYLWYFHGEEEGSLFNPLSDSPHRLVNRIPVTPRMLAGFIELGRWSIDYPEHTLPKRWRSFIISIFSLVLIASAVAYYLFTWLKGLMD